MNSLAASQVTVTSKPLRAGERELENEHVGKGSRWSHFSLTSSLNNGRWSRNCADQGGSSIHCTSVYAIQRLEKMVLLRGIAPRSVGYRPTALLLS